METGSEKPEINNISAKEVSNEESDKSENKNDDKKPKNDDNKKEVQEEPLRLRLRIQRLKEEDFFVSIGGRDLIIKLKTEIFRFLEPEKSSENSAANLRLIYKGKVLADAKFVESYKIQNEDTIQLVPFKRPSRRTENPEDVDNVSEAKADDSGNTDDSAQDQGDRISGRPVTFITFSTSIFEDPRTSRRSERNSEHSNRQQRRFVTSPVTSTSSRTWSPNRTMNNASIRSFRNNLQSLLTQVSAVEHLRAQENATGPARTDVAAERELVQQLDAVLMTASMLREDMHAEAVIQATEGGFFSMMTRQGDDREPRQARANSNPTVPEQKDTTTGQETKSNSEVQQREPAGTAPQTMKAFNESVRPPSLVTTVNESITIPEQMSSFQLRYHQLELLPHFIFSFLHVSNALDIILTMTP